MGKVMYCHISFRRPKGAEFIILSALISGDKQGKNVYKRKTRAFRMWKNQQYVSALQALEHGFYTIWEHQREMLENGVDKVYMVTDNSALHGWMTRRTINDYYTDYLHDAMDEYKAGGKKELFVDILCCDPVKYEASYKYCNLAFVTNKIPEMDDYKNKVNKVKAEGSTVEQFINLQSPVISGIQDGSEMDIDKMFR